MALALPTPHALAEFMQQSSPLGSPHLDYRFIVPTEPSSPSNFRSPFSYNESSSPLSQEESDDEPPLSPITFKRNEEYERSRLSYMPPLAPRPSSSPSTPAGGLSPVSPVIFSQHNLSSPSIALQPPPVFPTAGTQSLALRLKRPLPPLPKVDTDTLVGSGVTETRSPRGRIPVFSGARASPSSSDERDDDSVMVFSPASSQSPASSTYTTASSDGAGSSAAIEAFPQGDIKPRVPPITIPVRSYSSPLPQNQRPPIGQAIMNPSIAVTPATPAPSQRFPTLLRPKQRTASSTSIVIPSPIERPASMREERHEVAAIQRAPSPAPSITPSVSSGKSFTNTGKFTLRRIASRTRLFGRRALSASEPGWDTDDSEETVVVYTSGSLSMDDKMLRPSAGARSETPPNSGSQCSAGDDTTPRQPRRLEIAEVTLTPTGDVWEARELHDVIPKLRQLRAPAKIKM